MDSKRSLLRVSVLCGTLALALLPPRTMLAADQPPSDWIPTGIEQLARNAVTHTDFTFDKTMLQMSSGLIDDGDEDTRRAIAKLNGITVHLYHYAQPGMYDPRQLDLIRQQYHAAGWKHMVGTHSQPPSPSPAPGPTAAPAPYATPPGASTLSAVPLSAPDAQTHTDLFLKFQGADVVGMVLMQETPRNLSVVALSGDLSPLDLLHLRGHFGIPKFAGDGFTAADN
jgi:hypothetical protein